MALCVSEAVRDGHSNLCESKQYNCLRAVDTSSMTAPRQ